MIVQIASLGHLEQEGNQQVRVFLDALEVSLRLCLGRDAGAIWRPKHSAHGYSHAISNAPTIATRTERRNMS